VGKRVLLCLSHSIEEHDQLRLLHGLGYEVASIGGYIDPSSPHDPKRPALPNVPCVTNVKEAIDALDSEDNLGAAQSRIPDGVLDWLGRDGIIIYHHYLERLFGQWDHLRDWREDGGRIVWRTVGQSTEQNERDARPYVEDGLEVVRYSPKEENIPGYVGHNALIRFYKDETEWCGWTGQYEVAINITQHLMQRAQWCNYVFWQAATDGLVAQPLGPGSEAIGGLGEMPVEVMKEALRKARCYLYTGTQPASYTLGLIEAMMVGVPVVSIGPSHMRIFPYGPNLYEGLELVGGLGGDDPMRCRDILARLLSDHSYAQQVSREQQAMAHLTFGMEAVGNAWKEYLG
jgi:hypothetical protein